MATKKQKRAAAFERREKFLFVEREIGLRAQKKDRQLRAAVLRDEWAKVHDEKHFKFVDNCPICEETKRKNGLASKKVDHG